jgi:hypothetical protein
MYCLCVNVYCHRVTTQLQLINISYIITYHTCHMLCPAPPTSLYRFNTMYCGAHITKLISTQFYQFPGTSSLLAPYIVLNSQLSSTWMFLPSYNGPSFTPAQSNEKSFSLACFNIYILRYQTACLKNMDRMVASLMFSCTES